MGNRQQHSTPAREFEKVIRATCARRHLWRVFSDFCEMGALAIANSIFKHPAREERYLKLIGSYAPEEQAAFPQLLVQVALGLEDLETDFLGQQFMQLELGSHWHGQFFSPMPLCLMMAEMTAGDVDVDAVIAERGFLTAQEPAAGAGAMVIALAAALRRRKIDPSLNLHVTAIDVDPTAAHMAYIQLSLLGIPAIVYVGNTLSMEMREAFKTPVHHLGLWDRKLARGYAVGSAMDVRSREGAIEKATPFPAPSPEPVLLLVAAPVGQSGQLRLF